VLEIISSCFRGEKAYASISGYTYLWAKEGMETKEKLINLDSSIPVTFFYGNCSALYNEGGASVQRERQNVHIYVFSQGSHHLHAQKDELFNRCLKKVLEEVDAGEDHRREKMTFQIDDDDDDNETGASMTTDASA